MNDKEMTFSEWWRGLAPTEKDRVSIELSAACNVSLATVRSWGIGYRTPRTRCQDIVAEFIRSETHEEVSPDTLFPN